MKKKPGLLNQPDPKQMEEVSIFIANGMQIIHEPKVADNIIQQIQNTDDPVEAIADTTLKVIDMLERHAGKKGTRLSDITKVYGSNQLMGEIIELAQAAGVQPLTDEQKTQAFSLAVSKYLQQGVRTGKIPKKQLMQWGQQAQQMPEGQEIMKGMQGQSQGMPPQQGMQSQGMQSQGMQPSGVPQTDMPLLRR